MMPANAPKTSKADGWCTSRGGTYSEQVTVGKSSKNLMNHGNGADKTILTGSKSVHGGLTAILSGTLFCKACFTDA